MKIFELTKVRNCDDLIKQTPTKKDYNILIDSDTPKQHNGYDCGIFVCMYANDIELIGNKKILVILGYTCFFNSFKKLIILR
jgi:hypothetical protein